MTKSTSIAMSAILATGALSFAQELPPPVQNNHPVPAIPALSPEQKNMFRALEGIPADVDIWATVHVGNASEALFRMVPIEVKYPALLKLMDSVAIGLSDKTPETLRALNQILYYATREVLIPVLKEWKQIASPEAAAAIEKYVANHSAATEYTLHHRRQIINILEQTTLPRTYAAVTAKPGCNFLLLKAADKLREEILQQESENIAPFEENGWKGLRLTAIGLGRDCPYTNLTPVERLALDTKTYYIAYRLHQDKLVICGAASPDDLTHVGGNQVAVTETDKAACLHQIGKGQSLAALYIGADSMNAILSSIKSPISAAETILYEALVAIAKQTPAQSSIMLQGIDGILALSHEIQKLISNQQSALTFTAWQDGNVHLNLQCDSLGFDFKSAPAPLVKDPNALVYAYGSTVTYSNTPNWHILQAATHQVASAFTATLTQEEQNKLYGPTTFINLTPAIIQLIRTDGKNLLKALGDGWALRFDLMSKKEKVLDYNNEKAGTYPVPYPMLSGGITINKPTQLTRSVSNITTTISGIMGMLDRGAGRDIAKTFNFTHTLQGGAKIYKHASYHDAPIFILTPNLFTFCAIDETRIMETHHLFSNYAPTRGIDIFCNLQAWKNELLGKQEFYKALQQYTAQQKNNPDEVLYSYQLGDYEPEYTNNQLKFCNQLLQIIESGKAHITTENGKLIIRVNLNTPCLK